MCTKRNTYIYVWASTIVNVRHVESACLFSVYLLPVGTYMVCKCVRSYLWVWNIHSFIYLRRSCVSSVHHGWQIDFAKHCMQWPFIIEKICRQFLCIKCQSVRLIKRPVVLTQAHVDLRMNWLCQNSTIRQWSRRYDAHVWLLRIAFILWVTKYLLRIVLLGETSFNCIFVVHSIPWLNEPIFSSSHRPCSVSLFVPLKLLLFAQLVN